jgi:hypothetical protein
MFEDCEMKTDRTLRNIRKTLKNNLESKYNISDNEKINDMLKIHGINKERFDFVNTAGLAIDESINEFSIDTNSNKNEKTVEGVFQEIMAPVKKAVGFDKLYREMAGLYGRQEAKKLSGEMYDLSLALSDSTNILKVYCWSLDASKIVTMGREFGQLHSAPSERISSYVSALCETIHQFSSCLAGAIAIGTFFLDVAHIYMYGKDKISLEELKRNKEYRKKIENEFQQFVHSVNHLSRNGAESPFTNISIFDSVKLLTLIRDMSWYFPFEELDIERSIEMTEEENKNYCENYVVDYIMELQEIFLGFFDKGDPLKNGIPYRFPVVTVNLSKKQEKGKELIVDNKFLKKICKKDIYRYNIFVSSGTKVASCCFRGDQKVLIRNSKEGEQLLPIKTVMEDIPNNSNTSVFHNGLWKKFKKVVIEYNDEWYEILTENGKKLICTKDHIHPTLRGNINSENLNKDDYLLFNTVSTPKTQKYEDMKYEEGYLVGCFLGDGSYFSNLKNNERRYWGINLSLNDDCFNEIHDKLQDFVYNKYGVTIKRGKEQNGVVPLLVYSKEIADWLIKFVPHNIAPNKHFNNICFGQSTEFKQGIIDGLIATDGTEEANRIYTSSVKLLEQIECLCTIMGKNTDVSFTDRTNERIIIRNAEYKRNYKSYYIRIYSDKVSKSKNIKHIMHNNSMYFKIKSIKKIENNEGKAYCFNIKDSFPYFTLPNGVITHNCRLINDIEMMEFASQANSFGGGGSVSLGSHRVCTINFMRIALESKNKEEFFKILDDRIESAAKILKSHKELIKNLKDKGLQFFISNGWININRLFSTFGILGIYEAVKLCDSKMGEDKNLQADILIHLNSKVSEMSKKYGIIGNIEQIPAESFAARLANADKILYGEELVPYKLYANQFIPLWEEASVWERMDEDGKYNKLITGGGIVHIQIGEKITPIQAEKVIKYSVNSGCEHFALNSIWSECENGHVSFGNVNICPICEAKIKEKYTRVVGFFTPVSSWGKERKNWEFNERKFCNI